MKISDDEMAEYQRLVNDGATLVATLMNGTEVYIRTWACTDSLDITRYSPERNAPRCLHGIRLYLAKSIRIIPGDHNG